MPPPRTPWSRRALSSIAGVVPYLILPVLASCGDGGGTGPEDTGPAPVAFVEVTPNTAEVPIGSVTPLTATLRDAAGNTLAGRNISWGTNNSSIATVSQQGAVTALSPGQVGITATSEGRSGTSTITVIRPSVATVEFSLSSLSLSPGANDTLSVIVKDAQGNVLTDRTVTWSSSDPSIASVSATGIVSASAEGTTVVQASCEGVTATIVVSVFIPSVASVGMIKWGDFTDGQVVIDLAANEKGKSLVVVVPNLTSLQWYQGSLPEVGFRVGAEDLFGQAAPASTPAYRNNPIQASSSSYALPTFPSLASQNLSSPVDVGSGAPVAQRDFYVWSSGTRVQTHGTLAYLGPRVVFYEESGNAKNFTTAEYSVMDSIITADFDKFLALMGHPTDLDGNDRVSVYISKTVSQFAAGEAYVDGCEFQTSTYCPGPMGEVVFFADPTKFNDFDTRRDFYVRNYYPRNILHESTHIAQFSQAFRLGETFRNWTSPALFSEGQAEIMRLETGLGEDETWNMIRGRFSSLPGEVMTPFQDVYRLGAVLAWYLHRKVGDGYSQALQDAIYTALPAGKDILLKALGVPEPQVFAMMYGALYYDDEASAEELGLDFPGLSVTEKIGGRISAIPLSPGQSLDLVRTYSGGALVEIPHEGAVRLTIESDAAGPGVTVLVINR